MSETAFYVFGFVVVVLVAVALVMYSRGKKDGGKGKKL